MPNGPVEDRPFDGPALLRLLQSWESLHAGSNGVWQAASLTLIDHTIETLLPDVQHDYSCFALHKAFEGLLQRFDMDTPEGHRAAVWRSCAYRPASIFLDTLPVVPCLTLSNSAFACGLGHGLGLAEVTGGFMHMRRPSNTAFSGPWHGLLRPNKVSKVAP
jgi:hypothetical protein